jgi:hypothetical protein
MTPPRLPGPCVAVPLVRNTVISHDGAKSWVVETHAASGLDLDGHGSPVVLVPPTEPALHPDEMYWTVYVMRGECGHEVGEVGGLDDPTPAEGTSHDLRDLDTLRPLPPHSQSGEQRGNLLLTRHTFDGERYRAGKPRRR